MCLAKNNYIWLHFKNNTLIFMTIFLTILLIIREVIFYKKGNIVDQILGIELRDRGLPGLSYTIFVVLVFLAIRCVILLLYQRHKNNICLRTMGYIGKNSLYIFLYHILVMDLVKQLFQGLCIDNIWCLRITAIPLVLLGCIAIQFCMEHLFRFVRETILCEE